MQQLSPELQLEIANSQIWKSYHFLWSWHFQRPLGWGWPAGAAFPTPPSDNSNMNKHQFCTFIVSEGSLQQVVIGWNEVVQDG